MQRGERRLNVKVRLKLEFQPKVLQTVEENYKFTRQRGRRFRHHGAANFIELFYFKLHKNTLYYINHISLYLPNNVADISVPIILSDLTSYCHFHWLIILFCSKLQIVDISYVIQHNTYSIDTWSFFLRKAVRTYAVKTASRHLLSRFYAALRQDTTERIILFQLLSFDCR